MSEPLDRRHFLGGLAAGTASMAVAGSADGERPNVLFLMTDNKRKPR